MTVLFRTSAWLNGHRFLLWTVALYLFVVLGLMWLGHPPAAPSGGPRGFPGSD